MGGFISTLIRGPICFGFPGYMTFKSVRSGHPQAQTAWLQYWAALGLLLFIEYVFAFPLYWLPGYNLIFTAVMVAMAWPQSNMASRVFNMLTPVLASREAMIDENLRQVGAKVNEVYPRFQPYVQRAEGLFSKVEGLLHSAETATKKD